MVPPFDEAAEHLISKARQGLSASEAIRTLYSAKVEEQRGTIGRQADDLDAAGKRIAELERELQQAYEDLRDIVKRENDRTDDGLRFMREAGAEHDEGALDCARRVLKERDEARAQSDRINRDRARAYDQAVWANKRIEHVRQCAMGNTSEDKFDSATFREVLDLRERVKPAEKAAQTERVLADGYYKLIEKICGRMQSSLNTLDPGKEVGSFDRLPDLVSELCRRVVVAERKQSEAERDAGVDPSYRSRAEAAESGLSTVSTLALKTEPDEAYGALESIASVADGCLAFCQARAAAAAEADSPETAEAGETAE